MAASEAESETPKTVVEQLDDLFAPWRGTNAPGLVVGVALDGKLLYRRAFGMASLETAVANTPATRLRIGSTSKHFTGLLALLLAEDGKLDLDVPIRTYLPEVAGPAGDGTARQLLEHRGGARCHLDVGHIARGMTPGPVGAALALLSRPGGRNFAPGEAMIYNNGGYHLVSLAIERVGGAPFEDQLKARLFDPLGMTDTASVRSDFDITPGIASMHVPGPGGRWRRGLFPSEELLGEGGIVSTIDDMMRWTAHLRSRDRFGSPASWEALVTPPTMPDGSTGAYSLGLMLGRYRGLKTLHHAGGVVGGRSQMLTLPDDGLDIMIIANGALAADPSKLAESVVDIVLADRVGPVKPTIPTSEHEALLGDWWSPETGMIYTLADGDGQLTLRMVAPVGMPLEPGPDGGIVLPAYSIGELVFRAQGEALVATFGGQSASYQRVSREDGDPAAFFEATAGEYHCADIDARAVIDRRGERLFIRLSDWIGGIEADLVPLGPDVATTAPVSPTDVSWWSITLDRVEGRVTGFRVSTPRTRNLAFTRT